ncbi:hypothetical protein [Streptomyces sp. YIM 98790]|uniref:hypothetical protein n=1 Tax=Streptomyces sp. YIM 98790 TaxID=2689077 RepID=UPI00140DDB9D|nr:hypothetical protein [Streptomyces sp. YIM 98790]
MTGCADPGRHKGAFGRLRDTRAPCLSEPALAVRTPWVTLFLGPVNLLLGAVLAATGGAGLAVALAARDAAACRLPRGRTGAGAGLLGVLPAFLLGFACCVPALLLAVGTSSAAAVLPFVVPLRPVFHPLSLALVIASLVWNGRRLSAAAAVKRWKPQSRPRVSGPSDA